MKMSRVLATAAAFGIAMPVMAASDLEIRIVTTGNAATATGGGVVPIMIQGQIPVTSDFGLALWGANLSDTGAGAVNIDGLTSLIAPAAMQQFEKNLGLTNPAGYGGTAISGDLIQIGGGQNTIGNAGPTLFPVGTVDVGIASGPGWVDLATGSIDTTGQGPGDIVLTLNTGFANTLAANTGPVFPVNSVPVTISGDLTISFGPGPSLDFTAVVSVGSHNANGAFVGGSLDIPIDGADAASKSLYVEPRQFVAAGGSGDLTVRVDFAEAITGGSVTAAGLTSLVATPNGNSLDITFDAPANGTCYTFDLTGTTAASGAVNSGSADADFCICYQEGDVNFDSFVNLGDRSFVAQIANLFRTMNEAGISGPQVDLNRDGIINLGDRSVIAQPTNLFNDFTAVSCP